MHPIDPLPAPEALEVRAGQSVAGQETPKENQGLKKANARMKHPDGTLPDREAEATVRGLYLGILGREADQRGLEYWISIWRATNDLKVLVDGLVASEEYRLRVQSIESTNRTLEFAVIEGRRELSVLPLTIVDVGAQVLSYEPHVYSPLVRHEFKHRVVGFEPIEHTRVADLTNAAMPTGTTLLPSLVGDGADHIFHVNEPDATSSLLPLNRLVVDRFMGLKELNTVRVEHRSTITLDEALKNEERIHFLKLDIQGFELTALRHAQRTLERTLVVHCEVEFMEIYEGQPLFSEVEQHMRRAGFDLVDLRSICHYPFANTPFRASRDWLGWADAVFFRRPDDGFSWHDTLAQSVIALTVYDKPSFAAWLVRELSEPSLVAYSRALNVDSTFSPATAR
ncbi:MAG: FkbM family methyltransferase [Usitatibacteraceae bacterium]